MAVISVLIFAASLCSFGEAADFLGAHSLRKDQLEQAMFVGSANIDSVKAELQATFQALPKNEHGNLDPASVRYALHRYFIQKHGWSVKGLDPEGGDWHFSSHEMVKERATQYIQEMFDAKLHGRGLGLNDLASFAITVADLIIGEGVEDMESIYQALQLSPNQVVSHQDFDLVIRSFLSQTIVGFGVKVTSRADIQMMEHRARSSYPEYDDIVMWAKDLSAFNEFSRSSRTNPFARIGVDFNQATAFMKMMVHHFGSLLNLECQAMKEDLVEMQIGSSGRLLLSDFYKNKQLQLHESFDYLRNLGALEESDKHSTRLVIPNYIASKSRCLPFSGYYSVCCPDECQGLLGSIEREVSAASASPAMIAGIVSRLASDSMVTPNNVSDPLYDRLQSIANLHGGAVPLHGRLFMQWLHHVYPLECPFPHVSGTVKAVSQDEWLMMHEEIGDAMASHEEKTRHITADDGVGEAVVEQLPWSDVEELVGRHTRSSASTLWASLRWVMGFLLLGSFAVPMGRTFSAMSATSKVSEKQQYFV